jgi:hypothetical protein
MEFFHRMRDRSAPRPFDAIPPLAPLLFSSSMTDKPDTDSILLFCLSALHELPVQARPLTSPLCHDHPCPPKQLFSQRSHPPPSARPHHRSDGRSRPGAYLSPCISGQRLDPCRPPEETPRRPRRTAATSAPGPDRHIHPFHKLVGGPIGSGTFVPIHRHRTEAPGGCSDLQLRLWSVRHHHVPKSLGGRYM